MGFVSLSFSPIICSDSNTFRPEEVMIGFLELSVEVEDGIFWVDG